MVEAVGAKSMLEDAEGELPSAQPSLFPSDLVDLLPDSAVDRVEQLRGKRPGRPAGAINKRTAAFRDWIIARGAHPAEGLVECYMRPASILAEELGCSRLEAYKLQQAAREALLPYVESRMPQAVNVSGSGLVQLNINLGAGAPDLVDTVDDGVIRIDGEIIDNQGVS